MHKCTEMDRAFLFVTFLPNTFLKNTEYLASLVLYPRLHFMVVEPVHDQGRGLNPLVEL